jgi:hypothetical protein
VNHSGLLGSDEQRADLDNIILETTALIDEMTTLRNHVRAASTALIATKARFKTEMWVARAKTRTNIQRSRELLDRVSSAG